MKKIINGKKYNTETATLIAKYWNGLSGSDFRNLTEELYIKKTGEYFLHGKGGAMTKYSESDGNCTRGSSDIIPLNGGEAFDWGSKYMGVDDFEAHFGEVEE